MLACMCTGSLGMTLNRPVSLQIYARAIGGSARTVHWQHWRSYPTVGAAYAAARRNRLAERGIRWRVVIGPR